jgi:hypothetical protein
MGHMRTLARAASSSGKVKFGGFLAIVHWEVHVVLFIPTDAIFPARLQLYTRAENDARVFGFLFSSVDFE